MRNQTGEGPRFPATCARCGGRVTEPVSFCPHCGTHARLAFAGNASSAPPPRPEAAAPSARASNAGPHMHNTRAAAQAPVGAQMPIGDAMWASRPTPLFAHGNVGPFDDMRAPHTAGGRQWGIKGGTALTLFAFVVLYGGAVLLHRHDNASSTQPQHATLRTAEGSVQGGAADAADNEHRRDADARRGESAVTIAPGPSEAAKAQAAQQQAAEQAARQQAAEQAAQRQAADLARQQAAEQAARQQAAEQAARQQAAEQAARQQAAEQAARQQAAEQAARQQAAEQAARQQAAEQAAQQRAAEQAARANRQQAPTRTASVGRAPPEGSTAAASRQASASRSLAVAQESLAKNNLSAARRAIAAVQSAQPGNSEAFMLQQDLLSREKARDAALSEARACVVQEQWNCAWHNAGSALSIDASSVEAKALFNRAFIESGAASRPAGPGPDGPDVPLLPQ